ncbi:MAG TPA: hypothetical protein VD902_15985 [Symbiobacteriaceae bacterium]|nr:hypothetical protein [Symbiobacteriaceae bacterium]
MARTTTVWNAALQEYQEIEVDTSRPGQAQRTRLLNSIEDYIADGYATLRDAAAVYGCHNSTIYRRMAYRMGRRHDEVTLVWTYNKAVSIERANAARRMKRQTNRPGADANGTAADTAPDPDPAEADNAPGPGGTEGET